MIPNQAFQDPISNPYSCRGPHHYFHQQVGDHLFPIFERMFLVSLNYQLSLLEFSPGGQLEEPTGGCVYTTVLASKPFSPQPQRIMENTC